MEDFLTNREKLNRENIDKQIEQLKIKKQQLKLKENARRRKEENRLKFAVGGAFIKWFNIQSQVEAEQIAIYFQNAVKNSKVQWLNVDPNKYKKQ